MEIATLAKYIRVLRAQAARELLRRKFAEAEATYRQVLTLERLYLAEVGEGQAGTSRAAKVRIWHAEVMAREMGERARGEPVTDPGPPRWAVGVWARGQIPEGMTIKEWADSRPPKVYGPKRRPGRPRRSPLPAAEPRPVEGEATPPAPCSTPERACSTEAPPPPPLPAPVGQGEPTADPKPVRYQPSEEELCRLP